jgi:hypothetical protein
LLVIGQLSSEVVNRVALAVVHCQLWEGIIFIRARVYLLHMRHPPEVSIDAQLVEGHIYVGAGGEAKRQPLSRCLEPCKL